MGTNKEKNSKHWFSHFDMKIVSHVPNKTNSYIAMDKRANKWLSLLFC